MSNKEKAFVFGSLLICWLFNLVVLLGFMTAVHGEFGQFQWKDFFEMVATVVGIFGVIYLAKSYVQQRESKRDADNLEQFNLRSQSVDKLLSLSTLNNTDSLQLNIEFLSRFSYTSFAPRVPSERIDDLLIAIFDLFHWVKRDSGTHKFSIHALARYSNTCRDMLKVVLHSSGFNGPALQQERIKELAKLEEELRQLADKVAAEYRSKP